jgi:sulfate adenylyltransferase subunit 2
MTCTAAVESNATAIDDIINEIVATKTSERGETRIDDRVSEAAMEDRKKSGYF